MLQLQLPSHSGAPGTSILTAPQWQLPLMVITVPSRLPVIPARRHCEERRSRDAAIQSRLLRFARNDALSEFPVLQHPFCGLSWRMNESIFRVIA